MTSICRQPRCSVVPRRTVSELFERLSYYAAFAVLERAASYMDDTGKGFREALAVTRADGP